MRATLVYVGIGVAGFNADRPLGDREGSWIGHGVASIGASLQGAGHDVDLIDLRQFGGWDDLKQQLLLNPSPVYLLSISAVDYYPALKTVFEIKTAIPESKIIVGGIHPTLFPDEYDFKVIDTVVQGEGEITALVLLDLINRGEGLPRRVLGEKPYLDALAPAARELFDYHRELSCFFAPGQELPSITMLSGRGCPYHCAFCQPAENAVFGHPYRLRSARSVIQELVVLKERYSYKSITFWDDTFTFNPRWVADFCRQYKEAGIGATIAVCSRADIICRNEPMVEQLASAGLDWFVIGMETGSQRLLDLINKGTTVEQNIEAARICRKHGIRVFGTFMFGLPTETPAESTETAALINQIRPDVASPFWYIPIRGTKLYDFCVQKQLILEEAKDRTIERTGRFLPTLKGVDYEHIRGLLPPCSVI